MAPIIDIKGLALKLSKNNLSTDFYHRLYDSPMSVFGILLFSIGFLSFIYKDYNELTLANKFSKHLTLSSFIGFYICLLPSINTTATYNTG